MEYGTCGIFVQILNNYFDIFKYFIMCLYLVKFCIYLETVDYLAIINEWYTNEEPIIFTR